MRVCARTRHIQPSVSQLAFLVNRACAADWAPVSQASAAGSHRSEIYALALRLNSSVKLDVPLVASRPQVQWLLRPSNENGIPAQMGCLPSGFSTSVIAVLLT